MRSSKKRSRSSQNRPRTLGNIVNRVFDSSGPEGKVRGTPQQIIEKYQMLARDAQLSNDRVAAENFLQHAEHYTRMLAEAQREMAAEQEARQQQFSQNGGNGNGNGGGGSRDFRDRDRDRSDFRDPAAQDQPTMAEVIDPSSGDSGLVETPEARRRDRPQGDRPQGGRPQGDRSQGDRPQGDRPQGDRPQGDRPQGDRPQGDRPQAERPQGDRPQGDRAPDERKDRRDRDFRRDRDERRRSEGEAAVQPDLPAFITGTPALAEAPAPAAVPHAAPQPVAQPEAEAQAQAQAETPKPTKPRRPRKPAAVVPGDAPEAAE